MLAWMPPEEQARFFAEVSRERFTPATRVTEAELRADFTGICIRGICLAREEATPGICGTAVPVWIDGHLAGAFSVAVPAVRFDAASEARIQALLKRTAAAIQVA